MMSFHKIKVYARLTVIVLVLLAVLLFMFSNSQTVSIEFLVWKLWEVPAYALIFLSANMGVVVFLVSRRIRRAVKDIQNVRREDSTHRELINDSKTEVITKDDASVKSSERP